MGTGASWLFRRLLIDLAPFTGEVLSKLSTRELRLVARIMAVPHSLPRQRLIARILAARRIRDAIALFESDQVALAEMWVSFKGRDLKTMCAEMKLWRSGNKRQLSACLLMWRDRCRKEGSKAWAAISRELCLDQYRELPGFEIDSDVTKP